MHEQARSKETYSYSRTRRNAVAFISDLNYDNIEIDTLLLHSNFSVISIIEENEESWLSIRESTIIDEMSFIN